MVAITLLGSVLAITAIYQATGSRSPTVPAEQTPVQQILPSQSTPADGAAPVTVESLPEASTSEPVGQVITLPDSFDAFETSFRRATTREELAALIENIDPSIAQGWIVRATGRLPPDSPAHIVAAAHMLMAIWGSPDGAALADAAQVDMLRTSSGNVQHLYASALLLHQHYHQVELPFLGDDLEVLYYRALDASAQSHILTGMALVPEYWEQSRRVLDDWFGGGYIDEARVGAGYTAIRHLLYNNASLNETTFAPERAKRQAAVSDILVRYAISPARTKEELEHVVSLLMDFDGVAPMEQIYDGLPQQHHHVRPNLRIIIENMAMSRAGTEAPQD